MRGKLPFVTALAAVLCGLGAARAALTTGLQTSGQLGFELAGVASPGPPVIANITLANIPPGAFIQQAFLYTNDFSPGGGQIDVTFTPPVGPSVGASNLPPNSSDPVPIAQTFGYKIGIPPTAIVGNGTYGVNIVASSSGGNANQMAGAGLLVIYSEPLLPQSTITVNDGVFLMGTGGNPNTQTTSFPQLTDTISPGPNSTFSLLTFADDPFNTNEQIKFNGSVIGGPIDSNLPGGGSASIFNFTVTSVAGSGNSATLTSTGDIFGWHVAVLQTPFAVIPEPAMLRRGG